MKIPCLLLIAVLNAGPLHAADTALGGFIGRSRLFDGFTDSTVSTAKTVIPRFPRLIRESRGLASHSSMTAPERVRNRAPQHPRHSSLMSGALGNASEVAKNCAGTVVFNEVVGEPYRKQGVTDLVTQMTRAPYR